MGTFYDLVSVQEFLDGAIKENKRWQSARAFNSRTYILDGPMPREIHLNNDVEVFADILNEELTIARIPLPDDKVCVYTSFEYKGYKVFQIKQEAAGGTDADGRI